MDGNKYLVQFNELIKNPVASISLLVASTACFTVGIVYQSSLGEYGWTAIASILTMVILISFAATISSIINWFKSCFAARAKRKELQRVFDTLRPQTKNQLMFCLMNNKKRIRRDLAQEYCPLTELQDNGIVRSMGPYGIIKDEYWDFIAYGNHDRLYQGLHHPSNPPENYNLKPL